MDYESLLLTMAEVAKQDVVVVLVNRETMAQPRAGVMRGSVRCPFHEEKTPSLSFELNDATKNHTYHCFGCGASGRLAAGFFPSKEDDPTGKLFYLSLVKPEKETQTGA